MRSWRARGAVLGGLLALLPCPVGAQVAAQQVPLQPEGEGTRSRLELQLWGGVETFTAGLSAGTGVGPFVGLTVQAQPLFLIGVEAAYEAARLPLDDARLGAEVGMWSHTVLGLVKLGIPVTERVRPYLGWGFGVGYLRPGSSAGSLYQEDVLFELPVVIGVELRLGPLTGGLRLSYRSVLGEAFDRTHLGDGSGGLFTAGMSLGARF